MQFRLGNGIDFHQLEADIPLVIGGVSIPFYKGSKGHSDGDVLFHAVIDAVLGALALGDIGKYFPSNNPEWKDDYIKYLVIKGKTDKKSFENQLDETKKI
mgnify:CR=1 FL=1